VPEATPKRRSGRFLKYGLSVLTALAALAVLAGLCLPGGLLLSLTPLTGSRPLVRIWLDPGERFTLRYIHSVEKSPIWETHSVDAQGRIYIEEERYLKLGAGMGQMPGVGRMVRRGPYEVIENMHMPTGDFVLRIGSAGVDHTLLWRGAEINLTTLAPHTAVQLSARPINRFHRLWLERFSSTISEGDGS
jgi:hypothetical protein